MAVVHAKGISPSPYSHSWLWGIGQGNDAAMVRTIFIVVEDQTAIDAAANADVKGIGKRQGAYGKADQPQDDCEE